MTPSIRIRLVSVILVSVTAPIIINGQMEDIKQIRSRRATQELEQVLEESSKLDPILAVKVRAKAANLLWLQTPDRARAIFTALWDLIEKESNKPGFPTEDARTAVLRQLYPRDSRLAKQLIQGVIAKGNANDEGPLGFNTISGKDVDTNRLARVAYRLLDSDTTLAVEVLEQSLAYNTAPQSIIVLSKLRDSDALLANYIARRTLQNFLTQPKTIAVVGATHLISYLFPLVPSPPASLAIAESDESLRALFLTVSYQILKESLEESEQTLKETYHMSAEGLGFRTYAQGFLAETLATLSNRYAPHLTPELRSIASGLLAKLPAQMAQAAKMQANAAGSTAEAFDAGEENQTAAVFGAIARGEFGRAGELIDKSKDERTKKNYTQQLLKAEFKSYLALSELDKALKTALLVDDSGVRMQMLGQLAKTAQQKGNPAFSSEVLREARKTPVDPARKGMHARALFMLASETAYFAGAEALLVMEDGVKQINELSELPKDKALALNDPNSFLDSNELVAAFSRVGKNNLEEALQLSIKINNAALRQSVRLSSIEKVLSVRPRDSSGKPVTPANPLE